MYQGKRLATLPAPEHYGTPRQTLVRRVLIALAIGLGATFVLTLLEIGVITLFNPFAMLGETPNRFASALALPAQSPGVLLVPLSEVLLFSLAAFLLAKPLALTSYLHAVRQVQEESHRLYTPLTAVTNIRRAAEDYQNYDDVPTLYDQDQRVSILDLVQQEDAHQMILGVPGAGKTMALRVFQYTASQEPFTLAMSRARLPIYIPMKNYSLFLKQNLPSSEEYDSNEIARVTVFDYLLASDLPGMRHIKPYLHSLADQGRLLLLCDGLNEIDSNYLTPVSEELVDLMRQTQNRVVMTCREVDYREQPDFVQLVSEGQVARAVIYPLRPEQVYDFVEAYVEKQDKHWKHTAGQIMQVIDRSRLRYHCTNPMMLFTLMGIIDKIGVERGKLIDTRGRLLRESVRQFIEYERHLPRWGKNAPPEQDVLHFLSEVASAARWANDRNAIQLRISSLTGEQGGRSKINFEELADELRYWLDEHPAQGPFTGENEEPVEIALSYDDLPKLLQFSLSAALIEISPGGVLSFRHELIAEYFVAEYFFAVSTKTPLAAVSIREELLENVGRWSEPVAIWAGLLEKPLDLAERFGAQGLHSRGYILQALALGLVCVGVLWTPPQAEIQRTVILPPAMEEALSIAVRNRAAREELARIFTRCAEEGGQEVYRSLLPLIMVEGVDDLLTLLDQSIVPELLFTHLLDAVDNIAYETQVKRLTRVLGRFGGVVVERAAQLSAPAPERSLRLRAAAINVLGGTSDMRAVEPLIARLRDTEPVITGRATNALLRLGPPLTLTRVLQELEKRGPDALTMRVHQATLAILGRFLEETDEARQVSLMQYQHILERIVPVLTSNYATEPDVQAQARALLVRQGSNVTGVAARDQRWEKVIAALLAYLPTQNDVAAQNVVQALQEIGEPATPRLIDLLNNPAETVRLRVIAIVQVTRDLRALPGLLHLLHDPVPAVQQQVAICLQNYAPESVAGLVECVLNDTTDAVAERAALILTNIGEPAVEPVTQVLFTAPPARARLLVQILETVHDPRAVPALIQLIETPQLDTLLAVATIRALGQFTEQQVVDPLIEVLSAANPLLYEEAITALSQLGEVAFAQLIAALDKEQETLVTQRVRRAILGIEPFPGQQLLYALEQGSDVLARQIVLIFVHKGSDAAHILVQNLLHPDTRVRDYLYQALERTPGAMVVPALLEALHQQPLRKVAGNFLLKYPEAAITPLVHLLGETERGSIAAAILPQFGPIILRELLAGLDDQRPMAREFAHRIVVSLVRQSDEAADVLGQIVGLFNPPPPVRAREELVLVLANELAEVCMPTLLEALEDAFLIGDVAEVFLRLAQKPEKQEEVLDHLIEALQMDESRRGAEVALTRIAGLAVLRVGALITDDNQPIARSARTILRDIGVPALPFIWTALSDRNQVGRRTAALEVFRSMPTEVIKDELVSLLISERRDDTAMAVSLVLERVHEEARLSPTNQVMIPELIEYIQTHSIEKVNLRITALLLLMGEQSVSEHLIRSLGNYEQPHRHLLNIFLLLGTETQQFLLETFNDPDTSPAIRTELAAILGMKLAPDEITSYAQNINKYGISNTRSDLASPDRLSTALRSLGGLLAGGHWDVQKLRELRDASKQSEPVRELYSILLGWRYEPQIARLQSDLKAQKDTFTKEIVALGARIASEQQRANTLESDLKKIREEHGVRGNELQQIKTERDTLKAKAEQLNREKSDLQGNVELLKREKGTLNTQYEQARKELQALKLRPGGPPATPQQTNIK